MPNKGYAFVKLCMLYFRIFSGVVIERNVGINGCTDFYNNYLPKHVKIDDEEDKRKFILSLIGISKNPELVSYVSLIIHLLDQYRYGLLSKKTVLKASNSILENQLNNEEWLSMKLLLDYIIKNQLD